MKKQLKKIKKESGITLIALVITIIVLLILAGISISMLSGDNSILSKAGEARDITGEKQTAEKVQLAYTGALANGQGKVEEQLMREELNKYFKEYDLKFNENKVTIDGKDYGFDGTVTGGEQEDPSGFTISLEMTHNNVKPTAGGNVASVNDENIPIPTGFYPVAGTSKNGGFVISSVANDDLDNTKGGDQFVWVPVDQNQQLELKVSAPENITEIKLTDPVGEQISVGTVSGKTFTNANINPTYNGEYKVEVTAGETKTQKLVVRSLYAKDAANDFWASNEGINIMKTNMSITENSALFESLGSYTGKTITNEEEFGTAYASMMVSQFSDPTENYANSVNTYGGFYVGRFEAGVATKRTSGSSSATAEAIKTASGLPFSRKNKDSYTCITRSQASGLADAMYTGKSHLLTGAAWDRTLGWLVNTSNKTLKQINAYSTEWGNYSDDSFSSTTGIAKTGEFTQTKANNIYDLAGNADEWTIENCTADSSNPCVSRGGYYFDTGSNIPADFRLYCDESYCHDSNRF